MKELRDILKDVISKDRPDEPVALLFSGGTDSLHFGKTLHTPYSDQSIREFFFNYSWADLNKPKQKMPAIISFEKEFRDSKAYRKDDNMQCGSHLREHLSDYVKKYREIFNAI